jgi:hypothetical protein
MRIFACLMALFYTTPAFAWGLSTELNESWASARLVFPALKQRRITYCLKNEASARFDNNSVALQVESALRLWLTAAGADGVTILRADCSSGTYNLLVQIGAEKKWKGLGSYQLSSWDKSHYYSLVKFDTAFVATYGDAKTPITDFRAFTRAPASESAQLKQVSLDDPQTVQNFAKTQNLDPSTVFWSTYPSLIHELGHSFGLCDTYEATIKDQCDPAFSSATQPSSVMKDSTYFYLTPDDVTAIQHLFARFR